MRVPLGVLSGRIWRARTLSEAVRLNYYITDLNELLGIWSVLRERLGAAGCRPASSPLEVQALVFPDLVLAHPKNPERRRRTP